MPVSKFFAAVVIGLIGVSLLPSCKRDGDEELPPVQKIGGDVVLLNNSPQIHFTKVEEKKFPITVDMPGKIAIPEKDLFVLTARVQGRLDEVLPTVGDNIAAGATVAKIWSPDLITAAEELAMAKAQDSSSLIDLSYQKLHALGLNPQDATTKGSNFPLRSPITGVVLDRKLNSGSAVQPGDTILTIARVGAHQFQAEISPEQALKLKSGMSVSFDKSPDLKAVVEAVSSVADPNSRLIKVRCRFVGTVPGALPPETFMRAQVTIREMDALVVPAKALVFSVDAEYLFVRAPEDPKRVKRIKAKIAGRNTVDIALEPEEGLTPGSEVVSDGALLLNAVLDGAE